MQNELEKKAPSLPELAASFEADAGAGAEGISAKDCALPFLVILQKLSPQVDPDSDKYVKGAVAGQLHNTVSGQVFDGKSGIHVIPCGFLKALVQWKPRESGGGFVKQVAVDDPEVKQAKRNDRGQLQLPNGDLLVDTAYHFLLQLDDETGATTQVVLAATSTQLKHSRKWNSQMLGLKMRRKDGSSFTPPTFSHIYKLTTRKEKNSKGEWSGLHVEIVGPVTSPDVYSTAKAFSKLVSDGQIRVGAPPADDGTDDVSADSGNGGESTDVPF